MSGKIEMLPSRWTSETAKQVFETLECQRMEIIKHFAVPSEALGSIPYEQVLESQRKLQEALDRVTGEMLGVFAMNTVPQARVRTCKCRNGIVHEPSCPKSPN